MRFLVIMKADKDSEAGKMPSTALLEGMGKYNDARQIFEDEDFGPPFTPELREQERQRRAQEEELSKASTGR